MYKKILFLLVIFCSLFISNCATYVRVKLLKPSEINIGTVKKVAIGDFTFKGTWDSDETTSLGAIAGQILTDVILDHFGVKNNKGLPDSLGAYPGTEISDKIMEKLTDNRYFMVLKRETGDYPEKERVIETGKLLGVEAVITGSGNYSVQDRGEWNDDISTKNGITIRNKKYRVTRSVNTEITYSIYNVLNGELIATRTNTDSTSRSETADDEDSARKKLPGWHDLVDEQVDRILENSVIQIAPHFIFEDREIKAGKAPAMKSGLEYAKRYLWDDARQSWESMLSQPSFADTEDIINAKYNLGIYHEIQGNFARAELLFDECYKKTGKPEFLDAISRTRNRMLEVQRLQEQNQANGQN
jgi:hypothetical protein